MPLIGGDRSGSFATLFFIRAGNYLSLLAALFGLLGKGKVRWSAFVAGCLMLFIWFFEGMKASRTIDRELHQIQSNYLRMTPRNRAILSALAHKMAGSKKF